jgi:hypothetical protein
VVSRPPYQVRHQCNDPHCQIVCRKAVRRVERCSSVKRPCPRPVIQADNACTKTATVVARSYRPQATQTSQRRLTGDPTRVHHDHPRDNAASIHNEYSGPLADHVKVVREQNLCQRQARYASARLHERCTHSRTTALTRAPKTAFIATKL